jgi:hypothetical protein
MMSSKPFDLNRQSRPIDFEHAGSRQAGDLMTDRSDHTHNASGAGPCRERRAEAPGGGWGAVFRELRDQLDSQLTGQASGAGPAELALTVVVEALAVAAALGDAVGEAQGRHPATAGGSTSSLGESPAIYAGIDYRHLDHRARALRNALHSVDDYIWWGGLGTTG